MGLLSQLSSRMIALAHAFAVAVLAVSALSNSTEQLAHPQQVAPGAHGNHTLPGTHSLLGDNTMDSNLEGGDMTEAGEVASMDSDEDSIPENFEEDGVIVKEEGMGNTSRSGHDHASFRASHHKPDCFLSPGGRRRCGGNRCTKNSDCHFPFWPCEWKFTDKERIGVCR